jgi:soluble lytic murein transglycosylase-like protein
MRLAAALAFLGALLAAPAYGGSQIYEPLAASTRAALSAAVSDRPVPILNFRSADDAHKWLFEMSNRLMKRIPDRALRVELLKSVHYEATRAGLDPQLVLGIVEVESGFRKYAIRAPEHAATCR